MVISRARLINIPTLEIFGNVPNFSSYLGISRARLINFPTTGKFENMPSIPKPGRAYHKPICPFDKSVRRSFWESGHFLHICGSDDGIIVRIDFWQIEAERAGDTWSYADPSKNREKCGRGLVGHGSSIDVIYIGGAQAGGPVVRAKWSILRYSVFANFSIRWSRRRRRGTIRRKLLIARDH